MNNFLYLTVVLLLLTGTTASHADLLCGSLENSFGPHDYRDPVARGKPLSLVNKAHYDTYKDLTNPSIRALTHNLDYTLRAFPNHHGALHAMAKLERRENGLAPIHLSRSRSWPATMECYFERAIRFAPNDPVVYLLLGLDLHLKGRLDDALKAYRKSLSLNADSSQLHYNMGLLYIDLNQSDLAKQHATKAYQLGYPLEGLRNQLKEMGKWP